MAEKEKKAKAAESSSSGFGEWILGLLVLGAIAWVTIHGLLWFMPEYRLGYFLNESVEARSPWKSASWGNVQVNKQPHDCEFWTAPIGQKHCHYEADVYSLITRGAADGTEVLSHDYGKTSEPNPDKFQPVVNVSWRKVED